MFVAILRHRLWDIDVVASKILLLAVLLTFIAVVYVGSLALTGWWLRGRGWVVLVPLVVVACVAEPVRAWAQRWSNRLVFGARLSPREAVRALVDRFSGVGEVDELTELTRVVVDSTRASERRAVAGGRQRPAQPRRVPRTGPRRAPLGGRTRPGGVPVGLGPGPVLADPLRGCSCWRSWPSPPRRGWRWRPPRSRLLDDLAHHAGLLVANARLTVDLARELDVVAARAAELQVSRQQVVRAPRTSQRRRLERDIHDGAQQELVALLVSSGVLQRAGKAVRPPAAARAAPDAAAVDEGDAGRLAAGGAPPVLVESGLGAALDDAADGAERPA